MRTFLTNSTVVLAVWGAAFATAATAAERNAANLGSEAGNRPAAVAEKADDVALGYRDGYWNGSHRWHRWKSDSDRRNYQTGRAGAYRDWDHATATVQEVRPAGWDAPGIGRVALAYRDGFWDHGRRWHAWNDDSDRQTYRNLKATNYRHWNHNRDGGDGWRRD